MEIAKQFLALSIEDKAKFFKELGQEVDKATEFFNTEKSLENLGITGIFLLNVINNRLANAKKRLNYKENLDI